MRRDTLRPDGVTQGRTSFPCTGPEQVRSGQRQPLRPPVAPPPLSTSGDHQVQHDASGSALPRQPPDSPAQGATSSTGDQYTPHHRAPHDRINVTTRPRPTAGPSLNGPAPPPGQLQLGNQPGWCRPPQPPISRNLKPFQQEIYMQIDAMLEWNTHIDCPPPPLPKAAFPQPPGSWPRGMPP